MITHIQLIDGTRFDIKTTMDQIANTLRNAAELPHDHFIVFRSADGETEICVPKRRINHICVAVDKG